MLALCSLPATVRAQADLVTVWHEAAKDGFTTFYLTSKVASPVQILVTFPHLRGAIPDGTLPLDYIVNPLATRAKMLVLRPAGGAMQFRYDTRWWIGDPETARHDDGYVYRFPFGETTTAPIGQSYNGPLTHQGEYAIDFLMREGTTIHAAREGVVVGRKVDSRVGGPDPSFREHANFVIVYHADGSFAEYVHLSPNGALVGLGQKVAVGEPIAVSGNTGYSTRPHLHFAVRVPIYHGSKTIPTKFLGRNGSIVVPD